MAAKDGFLIVLNNGIRYLVVAGVGKLMMFIGRILIAAGTTLAFYCLITFVTSIKSNIMEPIYLLVIVFIIGFGIGALFIYIYSIAIDTILACFIVD
jgi:fucose permease